MATEKRLIDANNVEYALQAICDRESGVPLVLAEWLAGVVRTAPTVDAVEVVRCKDCICRDELTKECKHPRAAGWDVIYPEDDDFCSCGERRNYE